MGNSFMGQVVSLDDLRGLYGSRDEGVYAALTAPRDDYVGYLMGRSGSLGSREQYAAALRAILDGADCSELPAYLYGYAVVAWCHAYGEKGFSIDSRDLRPHSDLRADGLRLELDFWSLVTEHWPLPIPETPSYPLVGCVDGPTCAQHAQDLAAICTALELESDAFYVPLRDAFQKAVAQGREMIVFNY